MWFTAQGHFKHVVECVFHLPIQNAGSPTVMTETSLRTPPVSPVPEAPPALSTQSPVPPPSSSASPPPGTSTSVNEGPEKLVGVVSDSPGEPVRVELEFDDGSDDFDGADDQTPLNP